MNGYYPRYRSNVKYSRTSEAYELQQPNTRIVKKRRIKRIRSTAPVIKRVENQKMGISAYSIVTIGVIFICAISMAFSFAMKYSKESDVKLAAARLLEIQEINAGLEAENSSKFKLADIEAIATTKLGMSAPKPHQIVHINVPKQSYALQFDPEAEDISGGSFANKISNFFQQLRY